MTHCNDIDNLCAECDQRLNDSIVRVWDEDAILPAQMEDL